MVKAPTRRRVYDLASEGFSPARIAKALPRHLTTVQYHIRGLVRDGYLRRIGTGTPALYKATRKPVGEATVGDGLEALETRIHHTFRTFKRK